jgi:hypothetical protein
MPVDNGKQVKDSIALLIIDAILDAIKAGLDAMRSRCDACPYFVRLAPISKMKTALTFEP